MEQERKRGLSKPELEAEKAKRRNNAAEAKASIQLSGLKLSEFAESLQEKYINGEIDIKELVALTRRHHGLS